MIDEVITAFLGLGWEATQFQDQPALTMLALSPERTFPCVVALDEESRILTFYSVCERRVSPENRRSVSDMLTRTNYGLAFGNFEMDLDDGEVRFKTSIHIGSAPIEPWRLKFMVSRNIQVMDLFAPSIEYVAIGNPIPIEELSA